MSETILTTSQNSWVAQKTMVVFFVERRSPILEEGDLFKLTVKACTVRYKYPVIYAPQVLAVRFWLVNFNSNQSRAPSCEVGRIVGASRHPRLETEPNFSANRFKSCNIWIINEKIEYHYINTWVITLKSIKITLKVEFFGWSMKMLISLDNTKVITNCDKQGTKYNVWNMKKVSVVILRCQERFFLWHF